MTAPNRTCAKCGYVLEPWEKECSRCAWQAKQPCQVCGRIGIIGECRRCRKDLCEGCAVREHGELRCPDCAEEAPRPAAPVAAASGASPVGSAALPYPIRRSIGLWDSVVHAFAFMRAATGLCFRDKDLFLPSLFSLVVSAVVLGAGMALLWRLRLREEVIADHERASWPIVGIGLGLLVLLYLIAYFFAGMTVHLVDVALRGRDAKLGKAFRDACKNFLAIVFLALAHTAVSLITSLIRRRPLSASDRGAAGLVHRAWILAAFLVLPIIILEDVPLKRAAPRAWVLYSRQLLPIAVYEVAVTTVVRIIRGLAIGASVFVVFASMGDLHGDPSIFAMVGAGLCVALVLTFTEYFRTAYYTCVYLWGVAREEVGEQAPVPMPLAEALMT